MHSDLDSAVVRVNAACEFTIRATRAGLLSIQARAVGFYTDRRRLLISGQDSISVGFRLNRLLRRWRRPTRCGGGFAMAVRGGATSQPWMRCATGERFPVACYISVFLDGINLYTTGSIEPIDINQFAVNGLEAIELYRGPSETPIQYQGTGSACGALLLWTRTGSI